MNTEDHDSLLLYWSGELDEVSHTRVARQLEDDPEAAAFLASLQELKSDFAQLEPPSSKGSLTSGIVKASLSEKEVPMPVSRTKPWLMAAAALVVLGGATVVFLRSPEPVITEIPPPLLEERTPDLPISAPKVLSKRLFMAKSRFLNPKRVKAARERVRKARTRLTKYSI